MSVSCNKTVEHHFSSPSTIPAGEAAVRLAALGRCCRLQRGEEICKQGGPARHWFRLISGIAARSVLRADGRRQIVDILFAGDFFGFTCGADYEFTVHGTVSGMHVACYPREAIEALADGDIEIAGAVRTLAFHACARLESQLLIIGRMTALEKVASLLLALAARVPHGHAVLHLPLSRYEIADCLAISAETVSRALTELRRRGLISLVGARNVRFLDHDALVETLDKGGCASLSPSP